MFYKKRNRLFNFILLLLLIQGLCFCHFTLEPFLTCRHACEKSASIGTVRLVDYAQQAVTPCIFRVRNVEESHRYAGMEYGKRDEQGLLIDLFQLMNSLPKLIVFLFCSSVAILKSIGSTERIAIFVHRADGKKRLCSGKIPENIEGNVYRERILS